MHAAHNLYTCFEKVSSKQKIGRQQRNELQQFSKVLCSHELHVHIFDASLALNEAGTAELGKSSTQLLLHMPLQALSDLQAMSTAVQFYKPSTKAAHQGAESAREQHMFWLVADLAQLSTQLLLSQREKSSSSSSSSIAAFLCGAAAACLNVAAVDVVSHKWLGQGPDLNAACACRLQMQAGNEAAGHRYAAPG
jgi:hypothetical protein